MIQPIYLKYYYDVAASCNPWSKKKCVTISTCIGWIFFQMVVHVRLSQTPITINFFSNGIILAVQTILTRRAKPKWLSRSFWNNHVCREKSIKLAFNYDFIVRIHPVKWKIWIKARSENKQIIVKHIFESILSSSYTLLAKNYSICQKYGSVRYAKSRLKLFCFLLKYFLFLL